MPFNADTYRANRYRRRAWEDLKRARDIKERAARGEAYDWEIPRIKAFADQARSAMRMSIGWRRIAQIGKGKADA